jgi:hypothetical protein
MAIARKEGNAKEKKERTALHNDGNDHRRTHGNRSASGQPPRGMRAKYRPGKQECYRKAIGYSSHQCEHLLSRQNSKDKCNRSANTGLFATSCPHRTDMEFGNDAETQNQPPQNYQ